MRFPLSVAALGFCLFSVAWAGDDNPLKKAKVGDWIEYKMTMAAGPLNIEGTSKVTLSAKSDKEATLKTAATFAGKEMPSQEKKIDLTKPFDPFAITDLPKGVKIEKGKEGKETLKISGKEYKCTWVEMKLTKEKEGTANVKVWMSTAIPITGMARMEMTAMEKGQEAKVTMEFSGAGSK